MVHILVSGNMNYRAVDMLLHLVKRSDEEEMNDLFETRGGDRKVLETVFSMLVDCCVKERKIYIARRLAYKMDQFGIFPSRGSQLKNLTADKHGIDSSWRHDNEISSNSIQMDVEKQLDSWRGNTSWTDQPPAIKVSIPKGSLCNFKAEVDAGLPPDAVYIHSLLKMFYYVDVCK